MERPFFIIVNKPEACVTFIFLLIYNSILRTYIAR